MIIWVGLNQLKDLENRTEVSLRMRTFVDCGNSYPSFQPGLPYSFQTRQPHNHVSQFLGDKSLSIYRLTHRLINLSIYLTGSVSLVEP